MVCRWQRRVQIIDMTLISKVKVKYTKRMTQISLMEHSGSVVVCLTRDRAAAGSSITGINTLCP